MKNQNGEDKDYVLDSSAFLTLFEDEKGAEIVQELLDQAKKEKVVVFVCFATFAEVFYITFREQGQEEARKRVKLMSILAITRVECKCSAALHLSTIRPSSILMYRSLRLSAESPDREHLEHCQTFTDRGFL